MGTSNFKTIDTVSKQFGMSQVWLHQLRIMGLVSTKCVRCPDGRKRIFYNADQVEEWTKQHREVYEHRKSLGSFEKVTMPAYISQGY